MNLFEDSRRLCEFYPDAPVRAKLHYTFAHRFLPRYAHDNPFNFVRHDGVEPTRFIQARWQMFEKMAGIQPPFGPPGQPMIFRRVRDLKAWAQAVAGCQTLFVEMPVPEGPTCAFFIAVALLAPLEAFQAADAAIQDHVFHSGPQPEDALLAPLRGASARCFTLERSAALEGDDRVLQVGGFCEWTSDGEHRNSGVHLSATRKMFVEAVTRALALAPASPTVASSDPSQNTIRLTPPPLPTQPPPQQPSGATG